MGGNAASILDQAADDAARHAAFSHLVKALENRRYEFVTRLQLKHALGSLQDVKQELIRVKLDPRLTYDTGTYRAPSASAAESSSLASSSTAEVKRIRPYSTMKTLQGAINGRALMRVSDLLLCTGNGVAEDLSEAVVEFLELVQGGERATQSAVLGAQQMLTQQLDALLGVREGEEMEREGTLTMFVNSAFTRVDFFVYTYSALGAFGAPGSVSGACYVAELSIIDPSDLQPSEMDFLLSRAFISTESANNGSGGELETIMRMKLLLFESGMLSRMVAKPDIPTQQALELLMMLVATQRQSGKLYRTLPQAPRSQRSAAAVPAPPPVSAAAQSQQKSAWNKRARSSVGAAAVVGEALWMLE